MPTNSFILIRTGTSHGRRPNWGGGFTLVELIAVIVIIAVMAAVAVPTLGTISQSRGRLAAQQLLRDVSFARERAIASGTTAWVFFDSTAETWTVKDENPSLPGKANASTLTDPATGRPFVVTLNVGDYKSVLITSASFDGQQQVGFDWLGRPLNSSEISLSAAGTVVLSNNAQLTVAKTTGSISVTIP